MSVLGFLAKWVRVRMLRVMNDIERCPICGARVVRGFGLAGGGYGSYVFCESNWCRFFVKRQSTD